MTNPLLSGLLTQPLSDLKPAAPAAPSRPWSSFQKGIFSAVQADQTPLCIDAKAGSGKTTTLIEAAGLSTGPTLFLAFNKSIAEDIGRRLTAGTAKTFNALGHRLWLQNAPGARLEARKNERLVEEEMPPDARRKLGYIVGRIVSQAKSSGLGLDSSVGVSDFDHFITSGDWDIDDEDIHTAGYYSSKVFNRSRDDLRQFDFDDQLYTPVYRDWDFPFFPTVLADEAQDLNRIQHLFLEKLCTGGGSRLVAVGDRNQAIYGFRGALTDSLDLLKGHFRMRELPLSISYRCSQAVIRLAQTLVPDILPRDGAPAGDILTSEEDPSLFPADMLVMCRNNAPLFSAIMRHVRARQPCRVLSNALDGMAAFIRKFRTADALDMLKRLDRWEDREVFAAQSKGMDWKVDSIRDKATTVRSLAEGFHTVDEILGLLRQLQEGRSGPIFSTIHKAKGLEADHAYLIRPDLIRPWWCQQPAALQQEDNLHYVAITRAKLTFTYGVRAS